MANLPNPYGGPDPAVLNFSSSGTLTTIFGAFANPNGNVTPGDQTKAAIYYQDTLPNNVWRWSPSGLNWVQLMG